MNLTVDGEQIATPESILEAIGAHAKARPELPVIFVDGYPNGMFPGDNGPKELLDDIDSTRPIIVFSKGGHAFWGNSKALEAAGISDETPDPD